MTGVEFYTVARLTQAEKDGDVAALDALTTSDFTMVGPLGFLLQPRSGTRRSRSRASSQPSAAGHRPREWFRAVTTS